MTQVLFVQGGGQDVHDQWDDKLVESLRRELGPGYEVRYPLMPNEADPQVAAWGHALEHEIAALQSGAIVVGHSIGGTILVNVLAERAPAVALGAIVLIAAPFVGLGGWQSDDIEPRPDLAARLPANVPVFLYHGDKDTIAPVSHLALYAAAIPRAHVRQLADRDHQLNDDLSEVAADIRHVVTPDTELAAVAAAWDQAMVSNDPQAIGRFMADDWLIVGPDGGTTDKSTFLEQVRSGRLTHDTMTTTDIHVRQYGDVGVLLATGVSAGTFEGRRFREHERQSNVFVRTDGAWRCVLTHLSRLGDSSSDAVLQP